MALKEEMLKHLLECEENKYKKVYILAALKKLKHRNNRKLGLIEKLILKKGTEEDLVYKKWGN